MPPSRHVKESSTGAKAHPYIRRAATSGQSLPDDNVCRGNDVPGLTVDDHDDVSSPQKIEKPTGLSEVEECEVQRDDNGTQQPRTYATGAGGYNALKSFNGQAYTGMAVGGSHTWDYDPGVWTETKMEPDLWKIDYKTTKRRKKNAPKGSGAPVGMEYHWLIVAHQYVKKVDANTYETHLVGSKYKLTHKAPTSNSWSVSTVKAQRDRELHLLDDAKRRVEGLPPVPTSEKVKVVKEEKGQQKLDSLFTKAAENGA